MPTSKKGAKYVYKIYINMLDVGQILQKRIPYYLFFVCVFAIYICVIPMHLYGIWY